MEYDKPHLTYEGQLDLLISRGLGCSDASAALQALRSFGLYRLKAYAYPLRQPLPDGHTPETSVQHRLGTFIPGHTIEEVVSLYMFDRRLRLVVMDGVESFEVNLRVQIAQVLGRRDRFGHLEVAHLNRAECSKLRSGSSKETMHAEWVRQYQTRLDRGRAEDFIKHYFEKYDGRIPIWVATEVLDLGSLIRLYRLMSKADRNEIARAFGVNTGEIFHAWALALNLLRNTSAHHSRLWNRRFAYNLKRLQPKAVAAELHHLQHSELLNKLYAYAAVLAYCLRAVDPATRWPSQFRMHVDEFPEIAGLTPEDDMGFPVGWRDESLWRSPQ